MADVEHKVSNSCLLLNLYVFQYGIQIFIYFSVKANRAFAVPPVFIKRRLPIKYRHWS